MRRATKVWSALPVTSRIGIGIVVTLCLVAILAPWLAPYDPKVRTGRPFGHPDAHHWLGTDDIGHDLLSIVIYGSRASLMVGFFSAAVATIIGVTVGVTSGYMRGMVDSVLMRLVDVVMSLPVVPLTLVVGVLAGPGLSTQIFVIALAMWAPLARELRAQVLSLRERDFIQALRAMGARDRYVLTRHVVPAVATLVVPQLVLAIKTAVMLEASLSFLGLGDINSTSWGMELSVASARSAFLTDAWLWWVVPPGALIGLTVLGFALAGGAVEQAAAAPVPRRVKRAGSASVPAPALPHEPRERDALLSVEHLTVRYGIGGQMTGGCSDVSLTLPKGQVLGLVGESGSGKSTVAAAIVGLMAPAAQVLGGRIVLGDTDVLTLSPARRRALLGSRIGLVPQEAQSALNPVHHIGAQLVEAVRTHQKVTRSQARERAVELLGRVGLPAEKLQAYPHELSGGQRQRVVIAMAIANQPELLVADEPTSGLDVLVQEEILDLLADLRAQLGLSMVIVTHDLPVVAQVADRVAVMQGGEVVEQGDASQVLTRPQHDYTRSLLDSLPDLADVGRVTR